jgi:hypothetical protein
LRIRVGGKNADVGGRRTGASVEGVPAYPATGVGDIVKDTQRLVVALDGTGVTPKHPDDGRGDQRG